MKQEQENYSENEAYWNKRSEIFDTQILTTYEEAYRKTIDYTKKYLKDSDKALDIGCGTGVTTIEDVYKRQQLHRRYRYLSDSVQGRGPVQYAVQSKRRYPPAFSGRFLSHRDLSLSLIHISPYLLKDVQGR